LSLTVLELFGGIGACTAALKRAEIAHRVVDYVEIDKYAVASYNAINDTNFEPQDICNWNKDIEVDLIMHGSPCQDFSVAGNNAGGDKDSGTRSSLMYETIRIVEKLRPKYVIWENVKNILSKRHKHNFEAYLQALNDYGYTNYYQVLNAKDYGTPQNRERVFTISILNNIKHFKFPPKQSLNLTLKEMLDNEVDHKYYLSDKIVETYVPNDGDNTNVIGTLNMDKWQDSMKRIYDITKYAPTINTFQGGYLEPKVLLNTKIRKLTPKECWRLMGFSDEDFEKAANVNSNSQLYKQAGNSIVVDVLVCIFNNLLK
jgi:DNA (cytosine-5)-methyltransferase 1